MVVFSLFHDSADIFTGGVCDPQMEAAGRCHMEVGDCPVWGWRWCPLRVHSRSSNLQETQTNNQTLRLTAICV